MAKKYELMINTVWPSTKKGCHLRQPSHSRATCGPNTSLYIKKGLQFFHFLAHLPQKVGDPCYTIYICTIHCTVYTVHYTDQTKKLLHYPTLLVRIVINSMRAHFDYSARCTLSANHFNFSSAFPSLGLLTVYL